jgi:hypothetical protein
MTQLDRCTAQAKRIELLTLCYACFVASLRVAHCCAQFFRLEHEHLRNTEGYRSIDVVPLHFHTTKQQDHRAKVRAQPAIQHYTKHILTVYTRLKYNVQLLI